MSDAALADPDLHAAWDEAGPAPNPNLVRLDRLAAAGMEMIEALTAQAKGTGPKVVEGDVALAFSRVSRAVRMAVLLHDELARGGGEPEAAAVEPEAQVRQAQVDRAVRIVRRVAKARFPSDRYAVKNLTAEAAERLDNDDIYGLVARRPLGELVALICRDLGLRPDWERLAGEHWAQAEIATGARGSPFLEDDDEEDEEREDAGEAEPDPGAFQEKLLAYVRDPAILAAARRESG